MNRELKQEREKVYVRAAEMGRLSYDDDTCSIRLPRTSGRTAGTHLRLEIKKVR